MDHPEHYDGKTIRFKGRVMKPRRMTPGYFVPGRKAMTCCADDTVFLGFLCRSHNVDKLKNGQWLTVTAKVYVEKRDEYSGEEGPVRHQGSEVRGASQKRKWYTSRRQNRKKIKFSVN